jgi:putative NADH-flavin reductase
MLDDKIGQESNVKESGLDWMIVRPLSLTDGDKTGQYQIGEKLDVKPGNNISRADVTDFMLKSVSDDKWLHKIVTLSY